MSDAATRWDAIFPGLEPSPLRGRPADYESALERARSVRIASAAIQTEFSRLRSGDIEQLRGSAAGGLVAVVGEVDHRLSDLPPVFASLEQAFSAHAARLRELDVEAAAALARARTRWHALRSNDQQLADAEHAFGAIDAQVRQLRWSADPATAPLLAEAEDRWHAQRSSVNLWSARVAEAHSLLEESRREYDRIRASETDLVESTSNAIRSIGLGELADPTGLGALIGDVVGVLFAAGAAALDYLADATLEQLQALAGALMTIAEFVMVEALRVLAIGLKAALYAVAAIVVVALAQLAVLLAAGAMVVFALLPPHLKVRAIAAVVALIRHLTTVDRDGDPGGTYELTLEGLWDDGVPLATPEEDGRAALIAALALTADGATVNDDEFALVQLDNGKYILVLPGVTDLLNPGPGLNPYNRTVRDVDQHALPSSTSTGMDDNLYAQMVAEALRRHDVPAGAEIMIVGHSYGADTALDLAADPRFNGPGAYTVTHVAAAAYNSGPQLAHVPSGTEVLVIQNNKDVAVQGENLAYDVVGGIDSFNDALDRFIDRDPAGGFTELGQTGRHATGLLLDGALLGTANLPPNADTLIPHVRQPTDDQVVSVFAGGTDGAGHAQSNYTDYLATHTSEPVAGFESSVSSAGYGGPGQILTIDVSIPAG